MVEASISSAVEKLEAETIGVRSQGLDELRHILSQPQGSSRIDSLKDDGFHKILEELFRIVRVDKGAYLNGAPTTRRRAETRLSTTAAALRLVVEVCTTRIRHKTAYAVLDHIIDTLPTKDEDFCKPLRNDYLKSFRFILEHAPHGEHLRAKQWQSYVDFVLEGIASGVSNESEDTSGPGMDASMTSAVNRSISFRVSQASSIRHSRGEATTYIDDFFASLKFLTSISNCPLDNRLEPISNLILNSLEHTSRSSEVAFEVLNYVLAVALTENVSLALEIIHRACLIIKRAWATKISLGLREQMISTLLLSQPLYEDLLRIRGSENSSLQALLLTMSFEYATRNERDMLQLSDIVLTACKVPEGSDLHVMSSNLSPTNSAVQWTMLSAIASLTLALEHILLPDDEEQYQEAGPRKRIKRDSPCADLMRRIISTTGQDRLTAVQIALFIGEKRALTMLYEAEFLQQLLSLAMDYQSSDASWILLLLAQVAVQTEARSVALQPIWKQSWVSTSRLLTIASVSRAACFFMLKLLEKELVRPQSNDLNLSDAIFPSGTGGPVGMTDSSLALLSSCLSSQYLATERLFDEFANKVLTWLESNWVIPAVVDRGQNSQLAKFGVPEQIYKLCLAIAGQRAQLTPMSIHHLSHPVSQIQILENEARPILRILVGTTKHKESLGSISRASPKTKPVFEDLFSRLSRALKDFLLKKVQSLHAACTALIQDRASNMSLDIADILATSCIAACTSAGNLGWEQDPNEWSPIVARAWQTVSDFVTAQEGETFQRVCGHLALRLNRIHHLDSASQSRSLKSQQPLSSQFLAIMQRRPVSQQNGDDLEMDLMDSVPSLNSQASQRRSQSHLSSLSRRDMPPNLDDHVLFTQAKLLLTLGTLSTEYPPTPEATSKAIHYMVNLEPYDLISVKSIVVDFVANTTTLKRADALSLLGRLGEVCLQDDEYERNEAALCFCLQILGILAPLWASGEEDELAGVGYDIYRWYLDPVLDKKIASNKVISGISTVLDALLDCNPAYANNSLPSIRTSILKILQVGGTATKFQLVSTLGKLFNGYVLTQHAALFDDIVDSLPTDPEQLEGIGVRLYVLASLGARWHTVLRQAVYHIFETAANVTSSTSVALRCVQEICNKTRITSPGDLLQLFAPQILYTWLEKGKIETIPFTAFGYTTLSTLAREVKHELVAQVVMRLLHSQIPVVERLLESKWYLLLQESFTTAQVYAIATDVTSHRSGRETESLEGTMKTQLGSSLYARLSKERFPEAVAMMFLCLSDDRGFEKAFSNSQGNDSPRTIYQEICKRSCSNVILPARQQPSFRAKYIHQLLRKLCVAAEVNVENLWSPALLTYVYRSLLDDVKPALGSLHAAAAIRKLRMAVALAGRTALWGYPLEMLLHNLRPYLTQFHCAEDTFGIFWYLLEEGKDYLRSRLAFMAGLGVSLFSALSRFVNSAQDRTTQESQYLSTMSQAEQFRGRLAFYLPQLGRGAAATLVNEAFGNIVSWAKDVTAKGNSSKSSAEGKLLFYLLADQLSLHPFLTETLFDLSVQSLIDDFQPCADLEDDILSDVSDTSRFAPVLWSLVQRLQPSSSFRGWVAYTLGRAYALTGPSLEMPLRETHSSHELLKSTFNSVEDSSKTIINKLIEILWTGNSDDAGAAERTLSLIFSNLSPQDKAQTFGNSVDRQFVNDLDFDIMSCPMPVMRGSPILNASSIQNIQSDLDCNEWASQIGVRICSSKQSPSLLKALVSLVTLVPAFARQTLPCMIHLILQADIEYQQAVHEPLSLLFSRMLRENTKYAQTHLKLILEVLLYLRSCPMPTESTMAKRNSWISVNFEDAAAVSLSCDMPHAALLFLELYESQRTQQANRNSRRSSSTDFTRTVDLLALIYRNVDDADFFYGKKEESGIMSILEKLQHEDMGYKTLAVQSALFDSDVKTTGIEDALRSYGGNVVSALNMAGLHGISTALTQFANVREEDHSELNVGRHFTNVYQWDLWQEKSINANQSPVLLMLQALTKSPSREDLRSSNHLCLLDAFENINIGYLSRAQLNLWMSNLAVLSEMNEVLSSDTAEELEDICQILLDRTSWDDRHSFEAVWPLKAGREAIIGAIASNTQLRIELNFSPSQALLFEVKAVRSSLRLGQAHEISQFCLNRAVYLSTLSSEAKRLGLDVSMAVDFDMATTLWAQDEATASIRILQGLRLSTDPRNEAIGIHKAEILTTLGQRIAEARLEPADEVTANYLVPALKALGKETMGAQAGRVFHQFAAFCDEQLQDSAGLDDFNRIEKIRDRKLQEVKDLEAMLKKTEGRKRETIKMHYAKAKTWFRLDDEEWKQLRLNREQLLQQCLENYLLSLRACDDHPNDVLRFLALWLSNADSPGANSIVEQHIGTVPSLKFAPLMNQLSSRILDNKDQFQKILFELMYRICRDHPFQSLNQLFAISKSKSVHADDLAASRHTAAGKLASLVQSKGSAKHTWISVHNSNIAFVRLAVESLPEKGFKTGMKVPLHNMSSGQKLEQTVHDLHQKIPPPTVKVPLRADKDYSGVSTMSHFDPNISIAGGVSAPKIVTILSTDGTHHKMLLKGGNDDLRQDAIMEQVFEQVSELLKHHRPTRQRNLGIRTYKVIPLTHNAGIIEFVKDTVPLHDYLLPAHQRYFPKDFKPNVCRRHISDAQTKPLAQRVQVYRNVTTNFRPVMRYFFMERFLDPDDWFQKRLNYSRSSAAISVLGHVLGIGDRHGHNILLDEQTGEVVHIDLGVAFEAGRVLPVPEVVPFRLTRDLVDGMGMSGVEGPFRRCCQFTLEALRRNQEAIMTILDVLRWDPLYSWTVSPLRLQRMQENQEAAAAAAIAANADDATSTNPGSTNTSDAAAAAAPAGPVKKDINEPSEADRALTMVAKKLSASLSVEATVNELIRQATDERNLAVLYCGWAAYA